MRTPKMLSFGSKIFLVREANGDEGRAAALAPPALQSERREAEAERDEPSKALTSEAFPFRRTSGSYAPGPGRSALSSTLPRGSLEPKGAALCLVAVASDATVLLEPRAVTSGSYLPNAGPSSTAALLENREPGDAKRGDADENEDDCRIRGADVVRCGRGLPERRELAEMVDGLADARKEDCGPPAR